MRFSAIARTGVLAALLALAGTAAAQSAGVTRFVEGEHYQRLPTEVRTGGDGIEVVEVFSYACVHCYSFDPDIEAWKTLQPEYVQFSRVPAIFNQTWAVLAQAFYAADVLGVLDEVHTPIFEAIHKNGVNVVNPSLMAALFQERAGVAPQEFTQVLNSFGVRSRTQQAEARGRAYRVTGVPTMIVNGKYRVDGQMAGDNTTMLEVVDYLIALEAADADGAGAAAAATDG